MRACVLAVRRRRQSLDVCFLQRALVKTFETLHNSEWFFSFNFPSTEVILRFLIFTHFAYDDADGLSLVVADEDAEEVAASGTFELLLLVCFCCCCCCLFGPDCDDDADGRFSENRSLPCTRTTLLPVEPLRGRLPAARAGPSPKDPVRRRPDGPGRFVTSTVRLPAESHLEKGR